MIEFGALHPELSDLDASHSSGSLDSHSSGDSPAVLGAAEAYGT